MHRTQISIDDRVYETLKDKARRENHSLSALCRKAIHSLLTEEKSASRGARLKGICGIGRDPKGPSAKEHDRVLYGFPE
jgi:metal-responsive CopG/Arc/MetJ family transcriptional regulator